MHDIEPYFNWRHLYVAEEDPLSPFYGRQYSEFEFSQTVYNYYIHPQWDDFGSRTLYIKILYADYEHQFAILEFIGEWNDAIENDIMTLRREVTDRLYAKGIKKFILIGDNILNMHSDEDDYYAEWYDELKDYNGWVTMLNLPEQSKHDFNVTKLDRYITLLELPQWRSLKPEIILQVVEEELYGLSIE